MEPVQPFISGWAIDAICEHLEAVTAGEITRLVMNVPPGFMKSLTTNVFWPSWEWGPMKMPSMRYVTASYSQGLTVRDNTRFRQVILSDVYKEFWGDRYKVISESIEKVQNDKTGWKLATSVGGIGTGERGNRVLIDDPNSVKEVESETVRQSTNQWFTEVVPTRVNDPEKSAIIVIQQRTHENDVTGVILEKELDYVHLMIPMHFDTTRICMTGIGWTDPRALGDDGELLTGAALDDRDGILAWPERFTEKVVQRDSSTMGSYACTPVESPVLMADLSLRPIGSVNAGDVVIGFTTDTTKRESRNEKYQRRKLVKATVVAIHKYFAPVFKLRLESGEWIRCTEDHKWLSDRAGDAHIKDGARRPLYRVARVGKRLVRICPPRLPILSDEDIRSAGWLGGFFDGEGSVSLCKTKDDGGRSSPIISFYQGAGTNLPLCDRLEKTLTHFGFKFGMSEFIRSDRIVSKSTHKNRHYRIIESSLPTMQRFLHIAQPNKWRQRIIDSAMRAKFITGHERVMEIVPDGEEQVYALQTTTGNYVVWGLASSNSAGQFEQRPEPRGGGIFKRDHWQHWPPADWPDLETARVAYPPMEHIVASLDTAYTEKEENDPSALTIWGTFRMTGRHTASQRVGVDNMGNLRIDDDRQPKVMLMFAWQKHLMMHGIPAPIDEQMSSHYCPYCSALPGTIHHPRCSQYDEKMKARWGLVEWTVDTCRRYKVDKLLIEAKASGITAAQELARLYATEDWGVQLIPAKGDKVARAHSVQHLFSNGIIYAPMDQDGTRRKWCDQVVTQMQHFPKGRYVDLTDSAVHALRYLRDVGLAVRTEEADREFEESLVFRRTPGPLYPT